MTKRLIGTVAGVLVAVLALYWVADRSARELAGLFRASADQTVDQIHDQFPQEVHDRKLDQELAQVRREVIDRQIELTVSKNQLDRLRTEVQQLTEGTDRRRRLLAEAYPILEEAVKNDQSKVRFANQDYAIADFQREIDGLLTTQDREERQLEIKRTGLERLDKGAREGEDAIAEMRTALDKAEQDVAILRSRREQAETEAKTLDMVSVVTSGSADATSSVNKSLDGLKSGVEKLEARNDARRTHTSGLKDSNRLSKGWTRLESLKAIHEKVKGE